MSDFYQGILVGILGGLCTFNCLFFNALEERINIKLDKIMEDVQVISKELR